MLSREDIEALMPDDAETEAEAQTLFDQEITAIDAHVRAQAAAGQWSAHSSLMAVPSNLVDYLGQMFMNYFPGCDVTFSHTANNDYNLSVNWS